MLTFKRHIILSLLDKKFFLFLFLVSLLSACGGGGGSSGTATNVNSTTSNAAASSSLAAGALGGTISWSHPTARTNGAYLELNEIGGYDIRYKKASASDYTHIIISGNATTSYEFTTSTVDLQFEIAVFDTNQNYSNFITIQ